MNLLVDSQLPPALAHHLLGRGILSKHVRHLSLETATDVEIWEYAQSHGMTIVSKDQDFQNLAKNSTTSYLGSPRKLSESGPDRCI
ncbi:MAG: DUF5615 family PIN-like protein [Telluria sp.]